MQRIATLSLLSVALGSFSAGSGAQPGYLVQAGAAAQATHLLVVDKSAGELLIVDLESGDVTGRIAVGFEPHEVVALAAEDSPTGSPLAIVSLYGTGQQPGSELAVVDLLEGTVRRVALEPYGRPHGLAFIPGSAAVLVTVEADDTVLTVDYQRGEITAAWQVEARLPHLVVAAAEGDAAYASSIVGGAVTRLPLNGGEPESASVGAGAEGIAVTPDGREVWVGSNEENELHVFSDRLTQLDVLPTCGVPIRVTSVGQELMAVTCMADNRVQLFDVDSHEVVVSIELPMPGGRPVGTLASADGSRLFVADTAHGRVYEIDIAAASVLRTFETGVEPDGLALIRLP
ncbi:MAG TPA: YncE family protein [Trueperaceae bacterium]|nr:YncE family protein [Trueperaceae bacterium]